MSDAIDLVAPESTFTVSSKNVIQDPWMTRGLLICSKKCNKLYRYAIGKTKNDPKYQKYIKSYYGMNLENHGFLLNPFSKKDLIKKIKRSNEIILNPLEITVQSNGKIKKNIAINEVSIFRQSKQTAKLQILVDGKIRVRELVGDGALVATPAGSTAYNFSVGGRILNLESPRLAITPISPFRPRGWRGGIVSNKSKIIIKNLDKKKRPVSAVSDNTEIRNAHIIKISINTKIQFRLLYNKKSGLVERNIAEQFKF